MFNVSNLWCLPGALDDGIGGPTSVALGVTVVYLADTNGSIGKKRVFFVSSLEEVEMVAEGGGVEVVPPTRRRANG